MASTNKTTNANLSQFLAEDKPSWLTDYNEDMEKIDVKLGEKASKAKPAEISFQPASGVSQPYRSVYRKNEMGEVSFVLAASAASFSNQQLLTVLPLGYRPSGTMVFPGSSEVPGGRAASVVLVHANGEIRIGTNNMAGLSSIYVSGSFVAV